MHGLKFEQFMNSILNQSLGGGYGYFGIDGRGRGYMEKESNTRTKRMTQIIEYTMFLTLCNNYKFALFILIIKYLVLKFYN